MNYTVYIYVNGERCYYCSIVFLQEQSIIDFCQSLASETGLKVEYE